MPLVLLILFAAALISLLITYRRGTKRPRLQSGATLRPPAGGGLFDGPAREAGARDEKDIAASHRRELLGRAREGDLGTLGEAHTSGDARLYSEVLDALAAGSDKRQEDFKALVSFISKSDGPRANARLAERVIEACDRSPDRHTLVEMIHVAALSDDAATYRKAVEVAFRAWRAGRVAGLSAGELSELIESQYWVLDRRARCSGAGFQLRRAIADVRRGLGARRKVDAG